jgi:hypothetical protein
MAGQLGQSNRDRTTETGKPGQGSQNKTYLEQDSLEKFTLTGQTRLVSEDISMERSARKGQSRQDTLDRSARIGQRGKVVSRDNRQGQVSRDKLEGQVSLDR